ncbi:hypothetical protein ACFLZW_05655 [Chloroflexota bacterium]
MPIDEDPIYAPYDLVQRPEVSAGALRTYLRLYALCSAARRSRGRGRRNPGQTALQWAAQLGIGRTCLFNHLQILRAGGWLQSERTPQGKMAFLFPIPKQDYKVLARHPAVRLYVRVMHLSPNPVQRKRIAAEVGDLVVWQACLEHWASHGWRPTNVRGMLDSYRRGSLAACRLCKGQGGKR